jgi:hypothetical protein
MPPNMPLGRTGKPIWLPYSKGSPPNGAVSSFQDDRFLLNFRVVRSVALQPSADREVPWRRARVRGCPHLVTKAAQGSVPPQLGVPPCWTNLSPCSPTLGLFRIVTLPSLALALAFRAERRVPDQYLKPRLWVSLNCASNLALGVARLVAIATTGLAHLADILAVWGLNYFA